jgi:nicotinate-nucleotide pyrophosphorylase
MDSSGNQTFNDVTLNNISGGKLKDYTKIEYSEENIISNQSTITEAIEILESTVESNEIVTANALVDLNSRLLELKDNEMLLVGERVMSKEDLLN